MGCSRIPVPHNIESGAGIEPAVCQITGPLRPATIVEQANPPGFEPGPARLELAVLPLHHGLAQADDPDRTGLSGVALRCSSL